MAEIAHLERLVAGVTASVGEVTNPGGTARLKAYWAVGEGRAKWAGSPHPYTTLVGLLSNYVGPNVVHGLAANIFHDAMGFWPGDRKGANPVGKG